MLEIISFLVLGVVAGVMSGLFGIGGGIVMVPALIVLFGMDLLSANATSLAAMLLPVGLLGVWAYYKAGWVRIKDSLWIALGLFAGSFFGGEIAVHISLSLLSKLYAGILLYVAVNYFDLFRFFRKKPQSEAVASVSYPSWSFVLLGLAAGIFAGLFGKGGGIVIVPLLVTFFKYESKAAVATSLAALQLPVGLPSVLVYAQNGYLNLWVAVYIASGIFVGAFIGSKLSIKLPVAWFKKVYASFLLLVAVYMVYKYL